MAKHSKKERIEQTKTGVGCSETAVRESNAIRFNDWRQEKGRLMGATIASCELSGEALR